MKIRHSAISAAIALLLVVATGAVDSAEAAVVFSIGNVPMSDGIAGDQMLYVSGSFSIPATNQGPIPTLTSQQQEPGFVNLTVTDGGSFVRSFTAPSYFGYADGRSSVDNNYYVDLGPNEKNLSLDVHWDQFYLTIVNDTVVSASFSALDFPHGYFSTNPVPNVSAAVVSEPGTLVLVTTAFALIGVIRVSGGRFTRRCRLGVV
jgi:hypothetical protein